MHSLVGDWCVYEKENQSKMYLTNTKEVQKVINPNKKLHKNVFVYRKLAHELFKQYYV